VHRIVLAGILAVGLALRLWNIDYGLPFVYSIDEGSHFASRAIEMFWQDLDPGYYQNPAAFTYGVYGLLRAMYGPLGFLFDLPFGNVTEQFDKDPTEIWVAARSLAAVLCIVGVAATYWAARRIWGVREGLVAAAILCFAFLPVAYSRVAVTDVGAMTGVALALLFAVRARNEGRLVDFGLAGAAAGLAVGFKYTAGLALLPLGIAALARLRAGPARALGGLALGSALAVVGSWLSTRTCCRPSTRGGPICAIRPRWRPTSPSPARSRAGSRTIWTASPGVWAGPPRWPPSPARSWSCGATGSAA